MPFYSDWSGRTAAIYAAVLFTICINFHFICFLIRHSEHGTSKHGDHKEPKAPNVQQNIGQREINLFSWANVPLNYPVKSVAALPTVVPIALPRVQYNFGSEDPALVEVRAARQQAVKNQFLKCWWSYRERAWMHDELLPISGGSTDPFGGWAATLIDSLDTLWIMGFEEEFNSTIQDVERIDFGNTNVGTISVFETNIRHLGGLLSAYELSGDKRLLKKANEVGDMLYHAFDTPNHLPVGHLDFQNARKGGNQTADSHTSLAELGTFTLEFTRLSQLTGNPIWYDAAHRITQLLDQQQGSTKLPGMWPKDINARAANFTQFTSFSLGALADSAYEYFPKAFALLGGIDPVYKKLYEEAMETAINHLLYRPNTPENLDMLASGAIRVDGGTANFDPELTHLSCFAGGMFALGGKLFDQSDHITIGSKLASTCVWAYNASPAGIMPEASYLYPCTNATECE